MQIAISGASGFVGRPLTKALESSGHAVLRLGRGKTKAGHRQWRPTEGPPDLQTHPPLDAVVHLAGETVSQRWSDGAKQRIENSRVIGTRHLVNGIAQLEKMPRVLVSASAIGYYGDGGDRILEETAPAGEGFLADVCRGWEAEAELAEAFGVRVVKIRFGLVLGREGGALAKMLLPFRLGLGAKLGDGSQWMSWIHIDDLVRMIQFAVESDTAKGTWNGVAPHPVRNEEFTQELAAAVHRPAFLRAPSLLLKLGAGEMSQMLLYSQRCIPTAPLAAGFQFRYEKLGPALQAVLS